MKPTWYNIVDAPQRMLALYNGKKDTGDNINAWECNLLGHVERLPDGSWNWFAKYGWAGNQPTKKLAMKVVLKQFNNPPKE